MSTSAEVLSTAEQLFLRYGLKSVSMDDIANEAGISKKTLYQFVTSKAELVDQIVENHICQETNLMDELTGSTENAIDEMLAISATVSETLKHMSPGLMYDLRKYYRKTWDKINTLHRGHIYQVVIRNLERGRGEGLYRSDFDPTIVAQFYVIKAMSLIDEELFPSDLFNKTELVRTHFIYHLAGILSNDGRDYLKHIPL
ncbi:MAG: TetR/AcrR family transcriptional regulator [Saprospiraceae bacterium]|nr:TetR/AcrR family transcriptional regulator [Saprospiraceae bacterium]